MPTASTRRVPWSVEDLREILAGTVEDSEAAERASAVATHAQSFEIALGKIKLRTAVSRIGSSLEPTEHRSMVSRFAVEDCDVVSRDH